MIPSNLAEGAGINDEVGCDILEDPWIQKKKAPSGDLLETQDWECSDLTMYTFPFMYVYNIETKTYFTRPIYNISKEVTRNLLVVR